MSPEQIPANTLCLCGPVLAREVLFLVFGATAVDIQAGEIQIALVICRHLKNLIPEADLGFRKLCSERDML